MATLSGYITEVRRLLHDANGNFYTNEQLTAYINEGRQHTVQDTGCLRTLQITQTPAPVAAGASNPTLWTANTYYNQNQYVYFNIYIYKVTTSGTTGSNPPPYPSGTSPIPPSAEFFDGSCGLTYAGRVEVINYNALPNGDYTLDVLNINLYWGNSRIPLRYMPWSEFNAQLRFWQNYVGRPLVFSVYGQGQIYIAPIPDQVYAIELDTVVQPTPLVSNGDVDNIVEPYSSCVKYYAAYLAKYQEQSYGEAEIYKQEYFKAVQQVLSTTYTRRIPNPYSNGF